MSFESFFWGGGRKILRWGINLLGILWWYRDDHECNIAYGGEFECHDSCPLCDAAHSCDWSSCYDDVGFLDFLIEYIGQNYCIDLNHLHVSRIGDFKWRNVCIFCHVYCYRWIRSRPYSLHDKVFIGSAL